MNKVDLYGCAKAVYKAFNENCASIIEDTTRNADNMTQLKIAHKLLSFYDVIISGTLLHISLANGEINEDEIEFIKKLCDYGDVLELVSEALEIEELEYSAFNSYSKEELEQVIQLIDKIVLEYTDIVIDYWANVDYYNVLFDALTLFSDKMELICLLFSYYDGEATDEEFITAKETFNKLFVEPFKLKYESLKKNS